MGQKVHPVGMRLGIVKNWLSRWYVDSKHFPDTIAADFKVRNFLNKQLPAGVVGRIEIERPARSARIVIYTSRPGVIIGKSGKDVDDLRLKLKQMLGVPVQVDISEIKKPELDAKLVADSIAAQLVKRVAFRRAMKRAVGATMRAGAKGIKVSASGRLGGAEIARREWIREGSIPLHTLRADIDYAISEAKTTYGVIGVKVWIFKGEILGDEQK